MIVTKSVNLFSRIVWTLPYIAGLILYTSVVAIAYHYKIIEFGIPWYGVSIIGTAVALHLGFKNNNAYDRVWEARKIWGEIVNASRSWGISVDGYISNQFSNEQLSEEKLKNIKTKLIYRHIAWLYSLRESLLNPAPWEHVNQKGKSSYMQKYINTSGKGLFKDEENEIKFSRFLSKEDLETISKAVNRCTQLNAIQSRDLQSLRNKHIIDDFRHVELMNLLSKFYDLQGKNERIKNFPLPRQFSNMSTLFVTIFILLLPFSIVPDLIAFGILGSIISVLLSSLISWVYISMELVGDYSENPFQGMGTDIPMLSLSRTIERDLLEMLGEENLPKPILAKNGILM